MPGAASISIIKEHQLILELILGLVCFLSVGVDGSTLFMWGIDLLRKQKIIAAVCGVPGSAPSGGFEPGSLQKNIQVTWLLIGAPPDFYGPAWHHNQLPGDLNGSMSRKLILKPLA